MSVQDKDKEGRVLVVLSIELLICNLFTTIVVHLSTTTFVGGFQGPKQRETNVPSNHVGDNDLGDLHGGVDVDLHDILDNLVSLLLEGGGDLMVGSDVVDYCCIQLIQSGELR